MFGAFVDDKPSSEEGSVPCPLEGVSGTDTGQEQEPLARVVANHLASHPEVILKSQQRGEPELSFEEKVHLALDLINNSQSQFLYRFGRFLQEGHLGLFAATTDSVTAHYLQQTRDRLDNRKQQVRVRNRRWAAVQRLKAANSSTSGGDSSTSGGGSSTSGGDSSTSGGYHGAIADHKDHFTEAEMRRRNPLLYDQLVGQHLTEEEKMQRKRDYDKGDCRITTIIFDHLDRCDERAYKKEQEDREDDMFEEEDEEEDEEEAMEEDPLGPIDAGQKELLKKEFVSSMYNTFVIGKDTDFDYKNIDDNEEFDLLEVEGHDQEEKYFDEEEPCELLSEGSLSDDGPPLPQLCLDRRSRAEQQPMTGCSHTLPGLGLAGERGEEEAALPAVANLSLQ